MAKLSFKHKAQLAARADGIRQIRSRYAKAIELGYSPAQAAELARGQDPIVPPLSAGDGRASERVSVEHVTLTPKTTPAEAVNSAAENIPPNWQDLPWPNLRELALRLTNRNINSRRGCVEAIEQALNK